MRRKKVSPYADEPHVRVKYCVWDMEPPTRESAGTALVPQSLIDKRGIRPAFVIISGLHHRYISMVQPGHVTMDGKPLDQDASSAMRF